MLSNLYVFAIGGSGERVLYSLIMALASGAKIDASTVHPVFVDNDVNSHALSKCLKLIEFYRTVPSPQKPRRGAHAMYSSLGNDTNNWPSFFKTEIAEPIILNKDGNAIGNLEKVIGPINKNNLADSDIEEEMNLLFSENDLEMPLSVGFVGNPNIGSVVLNTRSFQEQGFLNIINKIRSSDGIFVIGSLFGGTGAAGFPLVINKFNDAVTINPANKPMIGGVAVLPYFSFGDTDDTGIIDTSKWDVDCKTFDSKTRAALMYYDEYMKGMDYCYYVGDSAKRSPYLHRIGGNKQNNPAHLVELMAALSVIDFASLKKSNQIVYKAPKWGFNEESVENAVSSNIKGILNSDFRHAVVKFQLMKLLFEQDCFLRQDIKDKCAHVINIGATEDRIRDDEKYGWGLFHFFREWDDWLKQLSTEPAQRKVVVFNNNAQIDIDNVTQHFYSDDNLCKGVATMVKGGLFSAKLTPAKPEIRDALLDAYKKQFPKGTKSDADKISEEQTLPYLMNIISEALENVLKKKCKL